MALHDLNGQSAAHLYEAYRRLREGRADSHYSQLAHRMLELLPALEEVCGAHQVFGLLSAHALVLLSRADYASRPHVVVSFESERYSVMFRPADVLVSGGEIYRTAASVDEAARLVADGLWRSGGWSDAEPELQDAWKLNRRA